VSHPGFDGDFGARFCLVEGEVPRHATNQEVSDRVVGSRDPAGVRVGSADRSRCADLGIPSETLRKHVRRVEVDEGRREGLTTEEREEIKKLRREVFELRRANEILKSASVFFAKELDTDRPR
jgi:hypothetical protein